MLMVGVADIASLKVAVMVTTLEPEVKLSESVSVRLTVGAVLSIVKMMFSLSIILFPPVLTETEAETIPLVVVETVQGKTHILVDDDAVIKVLETSPVIDIVGVTVSPSLKVAVMVTTLEPETKLSESVSVKLTPSARETNSIVG